MKKVKKIFKALQFEFTSGKLLRLVIITINIPLHIILELHAQVNIHNGINVRSRHQFCLYHWLEFLQSWSGSYLILYKRTQIVKRGVSGVYGIERWSWVMLDEKFVFWINVFLNRVLEKFESWRPEKWNLWVLMEWFTVRMN